MVTIDDPFIAEVVQGIEDAAHGHDYTVILCNSHVDPDCQSGKWIRRGRGNNTLRIQKHIALGGKVAKVLGTEGHAPAPLVAAVLVTSGLWRDGGSGVAWCHPIITS